MYDGLNRPIQTTLPEGNQTLQTYDLNNNILTTTWVPKPLSGLSNIVNTFMYNSTWALPASFQDGNLNTYNYGYDADGNLALMQQPAVSGLTLIVNMVYNSRAQLISSIDPTGVQTQFNYDTTTEKLTSKVVNTNSSGTVGGTITAGDVLTLTAHDSHLSGGKQSTLCITGA